MDILHWQTVTHAARQLGVSQVTVYRTITDGRLRAIRTPLGLLVDPASVEAYARTRRPVRLKGQRAGKPKEPSSC